MELEYYRQVLAPIIQLFSALFLSGAATTAATQIGKMGFIPLPVQKYPRVSAAITSVIATLVAVYSSNLNLVVHSFWEIASFAVGVFILSTITYNNVIKTNDDSVTKL